MNADFKSRMSRFMRVGPIMMALGGVLLVGGIVGTTASTNGGNQSCPSGTVLISKFNYDHGYSFEKPAGNQHVVTLSHASASGATWHSTLPVSYVIVKGGPNSVLYTIAPPKTDGTFSNAGLPKVGHHETPDVSNVQFCGSSTPATSTTSSSTTSTSTSTSTTVVHGSTTTSGGSTTTTNPSPTTTCDCQTTTTHAPTTTTCECTTTTHHVPTTTCECTTTTHHATTTTVPEGTTTTVAATTTASSSTSTSSTEVSGSTIVGATTTTVRTHHVTTTTKVSAGGQGGTTTFKPYVTVTSVLKPNNGNELPFTGSGSTPLVVVGIVLLATGLTLTLSQARRRERSRA